MKEKPLFSIVTACLNRADFIETAIQSVLAQNYQPFEHIIVDGGSTDGTLEILKRYPHLRVISEPDQGVYDAMNKGIHMAKGEIIGLLNSDDYYEKECFCHAMRAFTENPGIKAITGSARVVRKENNGEKVVIQVHSSSIMLNPLKAATFGVPITNAWFLRKDLFCHIGEFNLKYHLIADRDFLIRIYQDGFGFFVSEQFFYNYLQHENSLTISGNPTRRMDLIKEEITLAQAYMSVPQKSVRIQSKKWYVFLVTKIIIAAGRMGDLKTILIYLKQMIKNILLWIFH